MTYAYITLVTLAIVVGVSMAGVVAVIVIEKADAWRRLWRYRRM